MEQPYQQPFDVRTQESDGWGRLRTRTLLSYMEQAATEMSVAVGLGYAWYEAQGTAWAMRQVQVQRLAPVGLRDALTVAVWVSSSQRVRLHTDYEVRQADGTPVAVGRSEWVYIDRASRRPRPLDAAIIEKWPQGAPSALWTEPPSLVAPAAPDPHQMTRSVYCYEAEAVGVTSYAVYADWLEEAAWAALRAWGYDLEPPLPTPPKQRLDLQSLAVQYLLHTRPGDAVTITTILTGADPQQVAVSQQIRPATGTSDVLISADSVYRLTTCLETS